VNILSTDVLRLKISLTRNTDLKVRYGEACLFPTYWGGRDKKRNGLMAALATSETIPQPINWV
jgi:hypothetical protein